MVADGPEPARPRHGLCGRAHSRRAGDGPRLVRRGSSQEQDEQLHRFHRRDALPRCRGLCGEGTRRSGRRKRGRPPDGRRRQHGSRRLPDHHRAGAVRRRGHDDARPDDPADHQRI